MNIQINKEVTALFPGLRLYIIGPIQRGQKLLDTAFTANCILSVSERAAYVTFRKKREALARSQFLLAVETYAGYRAPDTAIESQVRQVSAITGIPLGVVPATVLEHVLTLRLSRPDELLETTEHATIMLPANSLVLAREATILGHFSVQGSRHLKPHGDEAIYILSYLPDTSISKDKIQMCLKRLKEQFQV